ncbi:hypothetical protein [Paenisporosarcina sp.]
MRFQIIEYQRGNEMEFKGISTFVSNVINNQIHLYSLTEDQE